MLLSWLGLASSCDPKREVGGGGGGGGGEAEGTVRVAAAEGTLIRCSTGPHQQYHKCLYQHLPVVHQTPKRDTAAS